MAGNVSHPKEQRRSPKRQPRRVGLRPIKTFLHVAKGSLEGKERGKGVLEIKLKILARCSFLIDVVPRWSSRCSAMNNRRKGPRFSTEGWALVAEKLVPRFRPSLRAIIPDKSSFSPIINVARPPRNSASDMPLISAIYRVLAGCLADKKLHKCYGFNRAGSYRW